MGRIGCIAWVTGMSVVLGGCFYTAPTGRTYMLSVDPAAVEMTVAPEVNFSNYVGYCLAMPAMANDVGLQEAMQLLDEMFQRHGYTAVKQEELMAERGLLSNTFVANFSYAQYFEEGAIEMRLALHEMSPASESDKVVWVWRARIKDYPISRANIKPALRDIFEEKPLEWGEDETLLPRMAAGSNTVARFREALERARGKVRMVEWSR